MIRDDESISDDDEFYIEENRNPVKKSNLVEFHDFTIETFLLGIWHFIITNRALEYEKGEATINKWYPGKDKYNRVSIKFPDDSNISEKLSSINVSRIELTAPATEEESSTENNHQTGEIRDTDTPTNAESQQGNESISADNEPVEEVSPDSDSAKHENESGAKDIHTNAEELQRNDSVSDAEPVKETSLDSDDSQHESESVDTDTPTDAESLQDNVDSKGIIDVSKDERKLTDMQRFQTESMLSDIDVLFHRMDKDKKNDVLYWLINNKKPYINLNLEPQKVHFMNQQNYYKLDCIFTFKSELKNDLSYEISVSATLDGVILFDKINSVNFKQTQLARIPVNSSLKCTAWFIYSHNYDCDTQRVRFLLIRKSPI